MLAFDLPRVAAAGTMSPGPPPFAVPGLPRWSAAVRAMQAGQRNARLVCLGDSTTAGHGAYAIGMGDNNKAGSWPSQLASQLTARGLRASRRSTRGNQNAADITAFDPRVSFPEGPTGWTVSSGVNNATVGGFFIGTTGTGRFRFDPGGIVDTFEVYYALTLSVSALSLAVDGGATLTTVSTDRGAGVNRIGKATLSVPRGVHLLDLAKPAEFANIAWICGLSAHDSTQSEISVLNAGWSGATSADLANTVVAWNTVNALAQHAPDLVVICIGINDFNSASPPSEATFKANVQALVTASVAAGADVMLAVPNPIGGGYAANHAAFAGYVGDVAAANGLKAPIDFRSVLGSTHTVAHAAGYMRDDLHPNAAGYARMAEAVRRAIS